MQAAAAIDLRNPSISPCSVAVESDSCLADDTSWLDAAPVWLAPRLTSEMVLATCEVPAEVPLDVRGDLLGRGALLLDRR